MRVLLVVSLILGCRTVAPAPAAKIVSVPGTAPAFVAAPAPRTYDDLCRADGFDFAYFVEVNEETGERYLECGDGPGTSCDRARMQYCEGRQMMVCKYGKVTAVDCRDVCRFGFNGDGRDDGTCAERDGRASCACCDVGEPGCSAEPKQPIRAVVPLASSG